MVGSCRQEDKGKSNTCRFCGRTFTMGKTFIYCPKCSFLSNSKNYPQLDLRERKINGKINRIYQKRNNSYYKRQLAARYFTVYTREWKKQNPARIYIQKKNEVARYNEETLLLADNYYSRWNSSDIEYLRDNSEEKTARQIAVDLGRTYTAIIGKASKEKITLITYNKRHGKLTTVPKEE